MTKACVVEIKGISKRLRSVRAPADVNLELYKAGMLAVVGDSGARKSTLRKALNAAIRPDQGQIMPQVIWLCHGPIGISPSHITRN